MYEYDTLPEMGNLEGLQEGRFNLATLKSDNQLRAVFAKDRIAEPNVSITRVANNGVRYSSASRTPSDLMGFEAIDIDWHAAVQAAEAADYNAPDQLLGSFEAGEETIKVSIHEGEIGLLFTVRGEEPSFDNSSKPVALASLVSERFARSPAHIALSRVSQKLKELAYTPHGVTTESFDPTIDPLGTLTFLEDIDLVSGLGRKLNAGQMPKSLLKTVLVDLPEYRAKFIDSDDAELYEWGDGITNTLRVDKATGNFTFGVVQDPAAPYLERASQTREKAVPFIETPCAHELCGILDQAGLMFHPEFQVKMMSTDESDRYGSIYTQLSREIAKGVNQPARLRLSKLFVPRDDAFNGIQVAAGMTYSDSHPVMMYEREHNSYDNDPDAEAAVRAQWSAVARNVQSEPAQVLITMIDDALARDQEAPQSTDLPVVKQEISIRDGACFDVVGYYIQSRTRAGTLRKTEEDGISFLKKTNGAHTYINTEPLVFNGVRLPKGALFSKKDDAWTLQRLTMFAFDNRDDQVTAAGSELAKAELNESEAIRLLGGVTLARLVAAA